MKVLDLKKVLFERWFAPVFLMVVASACQKFVDPVPTGESSSAELFNVTIGGSLVSSTSKDFVGKISVSTAQKNGSISAKAIPVAVHVPPYTEEKVLKVPRSSFTLSSGAIISHPAGKDSITFAWNTEQKIAVTSSDQKVTKHYSITVDKQRYALLTGFKIANKAVYIVPPDAKQNGSDSTENAIHLAVNLMGVASPDLSVPTSLVTSGWSTAQEGFQAASGTVIMKSQKKPPKTTSNTIAFTNGGSDTLKVSRGKAADNIRTTYYIVSVFSRAHLSGAAASIKAQSAAGGTAATKVEVAPTTGAQDGSSVAKAIPIVITFPDNVKTKLTSGTITFENNSVTAGFKIKKSTKADGSGTTAVTLGTAITGLTTAEELTTTATPTTGGAVIISVEPSANATKDNTSYYIIQVKK